MSYGYPPGGGTPPSGYYPPRQHGQAVTALVLGILGLVLCGVLGIPAYVIGRRAEREILASQGTLTGDGMARAGWICGLVAICLMAVGLLVFVLFLGGAMFTFNT